MIAFLGILPAVVVLVGVAFLMAPSIAPYEWVRMWRDRFAAAGAADAYTRIVHHTIVRRLQYVGVGWMVLRLAVFVARRRLAATVTRPRIAVVHFHRDLDHGARQLWLEERSGELLERRPRPGVLSAVTG
jgi:hypothetical protein